MDFNHFVRTWLKTINNAKYLIRIPYNLYLLTSLMLARIMLGDEMRLSHNDFMNKNYVLMVLFLFVLAIFLIFGCISRIDALFCSKYAQIAIEKNNLTQIHGCTDTQYPFSNGTIAHYVEVSHGEGQDCPAGCIYDSYSAIVTEDGQVYPSVLMLPGKVGGYLSIVCVVQNNLECYYDPITQYDGKDSKFVFEENYKTSILLDNNSIYWVFDSIDKKGYSGDCRKTCNINGRIILRENESGGMQVLYSNITSTVDNFVDCNLNEYKNGCMMQLAIAQNDITICQNITLLGGSRSFDPNGCYEQVAFVNKEPKYCENITSSYKKRECFIDLIKRTRNLSICKKFDTGLTDNECKHFSAWEHER